MNEIFRKIMTTDAKAGQLDRRLGTLQKLADAKAKTNFYAFFFGIIFGMIAMLIMITIKEAVC